MSARFAAQAFGPWPGDSDIWNVITPLRRETLGNWGAPVVQWLFERDIPEEILLRVAVPVVNIDAFREKHIGQGVKIQADYCCFWKKILGRCNAAEQFSSSKHQILHNLPIEILWQIFSILPLNSLYSLLLTSPLLCHIATPFFIPRYRNEILAQWADTPIILTERFITTYNLYRDFRDISDKDGAAHEWIPTRRIQARFMMQKPEWWMALKSLLELHPGGMDISVVYSNVAEGRLRLPPSTFISSPDSDLQPNHLRSQHPRNIRPLDKFFPPGKEFVLRNLSRREYVRANALTDTEDAGILARHPGWGWGLGHVIASRVIWGNCGSLVVPDEEYRGARDVVDSWRLNSRARLTGKWVGERFDVRVWEDVEGELLNININSGEGTGGGKPWENVTAEEREHLKLLWQANGFFEVSGISRP